MERFGEPYWTPEPVCYYSVCYDMNGMILEMTLIVSAPAWEATVVSAPPSLGNARLLRHYVGG